jgi:2-dehydropantoate 2-reductase
MVGADMSRRYVIYGAGPLGTLLGAGLAESGASVLLVGRDRLPDGQRIAAEGVVIEAPAGRRVVLGLTAVASLEEVVAGPEDVLLLGVKAWATATAVQALRERYDESTPLVTFGAGVRNEERAAERFRRVFGLLAPLDAVWVAPGVVAQRMERPLWLGGYPLGMDAIGERIASDLRAAGWHVEIPDSIIGVKWNQLVLDLNQATLALLGLPLSQALVTPGVPSLMAEVLEEAAQVLAAAGMAIESAGHDLPFNSCGVALRENHAGVAPSQTSVRSTSLLGERPPMWWDLEWRRGETEAGFLNGEILLLGEKHQIPTPLNATLLALVDRVAADHLPPGHYSLADLISLIEQRRRLLHQPEPALSVQADPPLASQLDPAPGLDEAPPPTPTPVAR